MSWAYRQSAGLGWIVFKGGTWFVPNQYGVVPTIYREAASPEEIDFARLEPALAAARTARPPDHAGRYSHRGSEPRGRFCEALVDALNALDAPCPGEERG
jgi:hypothetical protein